MSETGPNKVDDCMKLLDNGYVILLFSNGIGSYTAVAVNADEADGIMPCHCDDFDEWRITDDFTPSKALYRLVEKATTGRIVESE